MKERLIKIPIYNYYIKVVLFEDYKEVNKKYNTDFSNSTDEMVYESNGGAVALFRKDKLKPNVIVQECVHIVNFLFKEKGIKLDINNDEPQAYLMDYIFEKINTSLTKMY